MLLSKDHHKRQKDEKDALEAIFSDGEIIFATIKNCWHQPAPLEIKFTLKPITSQQKFISIGLHVQCSSNYPDTPPNILLFNPVGMSNADVDKLKCELTILSANLIGKEMIYELCQHTQEFLSARNNRPAATEHEEMMMMNKARTLEDERKRADSEQRERMEILKENERRREEQLNRIDQAEIESQNRLRAINFGEYEEYERVEMIALDSQTKNPITRRIFKTDKLKGGFTQQRPSLHPKAIESSASDQVNQFILTEWCFEYTLGRKAHGERHKALNNQLCCEFERELEDFVKIAVEQLRALPINEQQFLSRYLFVHLKKQSVSPTNFNCRILIGQDLEGLNADDCMVNSRIFKNAKHTYKLLPQLASQVICALKWLCGLNHSHGHLFQASIWYDSEQNIFRLFDYILIPRLENLCAKFDNMIDRCNSSKEIAIEEKPRKLEEGEQIKQDLFMFGTLLDSLFNDVQTSDDGVSAIDAQKVACPFSQKLLEFILLCQSGKSVEEIAEHPYLMQYIFDPNSSLRSENTRTNAVNFPTLEGSRLTKEFQITRWLGKGGFGDVFMCRNKLDENDYAIKRILLDPRNERLNQKIMREAKLFSKLTHENIVRYYCAWIESVSPSSTENGSDSTPSSSINQSTANRRDAAEESWLEASTDVAKGKLWLNTSSDDEVSRSTILPNQYSPHRSKHTERSDYQTGICTLFSPMSSNLAEHSAFDVLFEDYETEENECEPEKAAERTPENGEGNDEKSQCVTKQLPLQKILYIQMEYCKNSTLRFLIDSRKLYSDPSTIWRIFREILSGLQYIHHQNMIHRDIKPMNILLDWNWSAKIGDFGLATREFMTTANRVVQNSTNQHPLNLNKKNALTENVGTALYIAPELEKHQSATPDDNIYTSKIDVFSLGIVLFEMFFEPPHTQTERLVVLQNFRKTGEFPIDFATAVSHQNRNAAKKTVIWMTQHDSVQRPTVDHLLKSETIPLVESEDDFQKMFLQTIGNRNSKLYKWMISKLFTVQETSLALNYCFDQTICSEQKEQFGRGVDVEYLKRELQSIFELRGFNPFITHTFLPLPTQVAVIPSRQNFDEFSGSLLNSIQQPFYVLDSSGLPLQLKIDHRQSFIRYISRNPPKNRLKRYAFGKVFSQADLTGGIHPVERTECCLDIVGPSSSYSKNIFQASDSAFLFSAAELLSLSIEIANKILMMWKLHKWTLVIGHMKLLRAIFQHLTITDESMPKVLNALYHFAVSNKRLPTDKRCEVLVNRCELGAQTATALIRFTEPTSDLESFRELLKPLMRSKLSEIKDAVKNAMSEITSIIDRLQDFTGEKCLNVVFDCGLSYRPQTFNTGFLFLLRVELVLAKALVPKSTVILAGGSYDDCIIKERHPQDPFPEFPIFALGFNLPMDNLAQIHQVVSDLKNVEIGEERELAIASTSEYPVGNFVKCIALICAISVELERDACQLAKNLWKLNIGAEVFPEPVTSVHHALEHCQHHSIHFLLVLTDRDEVVFYASEISGTISPSMFGSTSTKKFSAHSSSSINGYLVAHSRISHEESIKILSSCITEIETTSRATSNIQEKVLCADEGQQATPIHNRANSSFANVNINYPPDERPAYNTKKKIEMQLRACLTERILSKFSSKTKVEIFVTDLTPDLIRTISSTIDRNFTSIEFSRAFDVILKQSGRQKQQVDQLYRSLEQHFTKGASTPAAIQAILIIWSRTVENFFKIIA